LGLSFEIIPENDPPSIGKGTDVNGVGSSEPIRQRVRRGDEPLQTPLTSVPSCFLPLYIIATDARGLPFGRRSLGAESSEPAAPVAPTPQAEVTPSVSEASPSPSLEPGYAQCTHTPQGVVHCASKKEESGESPPDFIVPCGGWLRELCGHGNVRWIPLKCHKWTCEECAPGKLMEFRERLQGAFELSEEKGWTLKFVTLTWAEDVTKKQVRLHLQHLIKALRRKYGYCEYARVPEWTKNHRIHLHLAMIMPFVPQKVLSAMWRGFAGAPNVWITAVQDVRRLRNELGKYLAKGPAGKVSYSRNFPAPVPLVTVKPGVCDSCGEEHRFTFLTHDMAEKDFGLEIAGRDTPGFVLRPTGGAAFCGCWEIVAPGVESSAESGIPP